MRTQSTSSQMLEVVTSLATQAAGAGKTAAAYPETGSQFKEILNEALSNGKTLSQEDAGSRNVAERQEAADAAKNKAAPEPREVSGEITTPNPENADTGETEIDAKIAAIAAGMMQQPAVAELFAQQMAEEPQEGESVTDTGTFTQATGPGTAVLPQSVEKLPPEAPPAQAQQPSLEPQISEAAATSPTAGAGNTPAMAQTGSAQAIPAGLAEETPTLTTQAVTPPPQQAELQAEVPAEIPPAISQEEEAQQKFDNMIASAKKMLVAPKDPVLDASVNPRIAPETEGEGKALRGFEVPEELRAQVPAEVKEKAEQPQVVRVTEKSVRSAAQTEDPEEIILASHDTARPTVEVNTQAAPVAKAANPVQYDPAQQIQAQVIENLEKDTMEFRMQLSPQELGKIDVKMVLESGRLTVEIISAAARTNELLSRQTEALAATLRTSGVNLQSVQVVTSTQQADSHLEQSLNMMDQPGQEAARNGEDGKGLSQRGSGRSREQDSQDTAAEQQPQPKTLLNYTI